MKKLVVSLVFNMTILFLNAQDSEPKKIPIAGIEAHIKYKDVKKLNLSKLKKAIR